MNASRGRRTASIAVFVGVLVLLASCGSSGGGSGTDYGPPAPGGIYRTTQTADPPSLDPHRDVSFRTQRAVSLVYSKLVAFKSGEDIPFGAQELEGDLAETWEMSPDAKTFTFHLRQGVKFHDVPPVNGREFTSADVACTMQRIKEMPGVQIGNLALVDQIETPDDYTVTFRLSAPFPDFIYNVAGYFMWILPCEAKDGGYDVETQAIGTGPFMLDHWTKDQEMVFTKHPDYYDQPKPYLDGITVSLVQDDAAQVAALRTGKIDVAGFSDPERVEAVTSANPDFELRDIQSSSGPALFSNQKVEPFDDPRVREAMALAIDREAMLKAMRPLGGEMSGPLGPTIPGALTPEEATELQPYDPEQAKELLAEAGYPDGFDVTLTLTSGYGQTSVNEAQWVQQDLAAIGINVELDVQEYATWISETLPAKDYALGFIPQTPYLRAGQLFETNFLSNSPRNWFNIDDPELDSMILEAREIVDEAARLEAEKDIQSYIMTTHFNPYMLYVSNTTYTIAPYVHNWYPDASSVYNQAWLRNVQLGENAPSRE